MSVRSLKYLFLFVVLLGLADSLYLAITTYLNVSPVCGPAHGCDIVQTSRYSRFFGVPWAYLAVAYYIAGAFIGTALDTSALMRRAALYFGALGVAVALWSAYLQIFVIKAFCIYCSALDAFAVILLVLALLIHSRVRSSARSNALGSQHQ
jgi:uncharacterized membrane protein